MKKAYFFVQIFPLLFILIFFTACSGQEKSQEKAREKIQLSKASPTFSGIPSHPQISAYIRHIFQDKNGNFWFGTNGDGVVHYDGNSLYYFSNAQGFDGHQITGITEDNEKNIWFSTNQGIVKYDWSTNKKGGKRFTNYSDPKYFGGQRFWSIYTDSKNNIWAGSVRGIFRFNGINWVPFELPYPEELIGEFLTDGTSCSILEDSAGNLWFGTRGFGVFKYDLSAEEEGGNKFTQYTKKDGLADNEVFGICEDRNGNIWFGTSYGGLSFFNGVHFVNYTQFNSNIGNNEICIIYKDKAGNIWFSSEGFGVYRFDPSDLLRTDSKSFTNFSEKQGLGVKAVQSIFEDKEGRFWVGGGDGLYQYDGKSFFNVTKNGPWK